MAPKSDKAGGRGKAGTGGTGKPAKKRWCQGKITFSDGGCLYIKDKDLANEIYARFLATGKICITIDNPNQPLKEINLLCGC
jgi:hypothetical protein